MMKNKIFLWSKTDIAAALGVDVELLPSLISPILKKNIEWVPGRQKFKPEIAFKIFRDVNALWSDSYIFQIMGYEPNEPLIVPDWN